MGRLTSADNFLALLQGKPRRVRDGEWLCLCPAHSDTNPSLSVKALPDKLLISCHAGCPPEAVVKALGLEMADLFLNGCKPKPSQKKEILAVYDYGAFQVVRYQPKAFAQRRPDGKGGYIYNLKGVTPRLYHADNLPQAIAEGRTIWLVEGEKDADRLISLGLVATTSPMGAGKWRDAYAEALIGADVVIVPDNDGPGRAHAQKATQSLVGKAGRIRLLEVPGAKDTSDWLDNGGTLSALLALAEKAPDFRAPPPSETSSAPHDFHLTDMGNAGRFARDHQGRVRYCYARKQWLVWTGKVWAWDDGARVGELARETVRRLYAKAANETDSKARQDLANHALKCESESRISAMLSLAQSESGIPIKAEDLDTNDWLLNVQNGTMDLRIGQLRPHDPADLITVLLPWNYNPEARCSRWLTFLEAVTQGDPGLVAYLQRAVGYSLTGSTREQRLFFLWGGGLNGKSTFLAIIRKLTADYGWRADASTFMLQDKASNGPKEGLANLEGKRFVCSTELEEGRKLAVVAIKDLTGGETMTADRKYQHQTEYKPKCKLWLVGNHRPVITDTTLSIWRRMQLIPFTYVVPESNIDLNLADKLTQEMEGILRWAVEGCQEWLNEGLGEPEAVKTATEAYKREQDILGPFLEDRCDTTFTATVTKKALREAYTAWCAENGQDPVSPKTFRGRLLEKGFREGFNPSGRVRLWKGLSLQDDKTDATDKTAPIFQEFPYEEKLEKSPEKHARSVRGVSAKADAGTDSDPSWLLPVSGRVVSQSWVLELWERKHRPIIHLSNTQVIAELEAYLRGNNVGLAELEAAVNFLEKGDDR